MDQWPHAPIHRLADAGTYIVTASTLHHQHLLSTARHLDTMQRSLFNLSDEYSWDLQAWAIFSNHYHIVASSRNGSGPLAEMLARLHNGASREINRMDGVRERQVWYQYWDTRLTYHTAYLARLKYVTLNPVRHGLARIAEDYRWCSARWFARNVSRAFYRSVMSFPIDRVNVLDGFDAVPPVE